MTAYQSISQDQGCQWARDTQEEEEEGREGEEAGGVAQVLRAEEHLLLGGSLSSRHQVPRSDTPFVDLWNYNYQSCSD